MVSQAQSSDKGSPGRLCFVKNVRLDSNTIDCPSTSDQKANVETASTCTKIGTSQRLEAFPLAGPNPPLLLQSLQVPQSSPHFYEENEQRADTDTLSLLGRPAKNQYWRQPCQKPRFSQDTCRSTLFRTDTVSQRCFRPLRQGSFR